MTTEILAPWDMGSPKYTMNVRMTGLDFAAAVTRVREELQKEGFGVLTEIDMQATLKKKLDVDLPPYLILGACNPPLAHRAVTAEPGVGALLPCNVVVAAEKDAIFVGAIDPVAMFSVVEREDVAPIAQEVRTKIEAVLKALA